MRRLAGLVALLAAIAAAPVTAPAEAGAAARASLGLPAAKGCLTGKRLAFRIAAPAARRAALARIRVNGRLARVLRGPALRQRVVLRRLKGAVTKRTRSGMRRRSGQVLVTLVIVPRSGRKQTVRRRYRLCARDVAVLSPKGGKKTKPKGGPKPGGGGGGAGGPGSAAPGPGGAPGGATAAQDGFGPADPSPRRPLPGCADDTGFPRGTHPGGEWPVNGHDYDNTRTQDAEKTIGVPEAGRLGELWRFSTTESGGAGDVTGTPIIRDGCVYAATTRGTVFALNAETGKLVWKADLPRGGRVYQSPSVRYGKVFVGITASVATDVCTENCVEPYFAAFDQASGRVEWASGGLEQAEGADILGAPLVFDASDNGVSDPVVFTGISAYGAEADFGDGSIRYANDGSFVIMDATTGEVLRQTYVVKKDPADEHAGCGIWSSPAVDFESRMGYVGVSNPHRPESEHPNCNSVIEFVADRTHPEFGKITRNFKGDPDDLVREFVPQYPCQAIPGFPRPTPSQEVGSCTDMDLAIGAPPNLIRAADGSKMLGVGQKSGAYHLWDIATGKKVWRTPIGIPTIIGGIVGGTAYDGERIYGPSTVPGFVFGLEKAGGTPQWVGQHSAVSYGNPTTTANGVVYTTTQRNYLNAYEAATGRLLLEAPLPPGTDEAVAFQGTVGGVAVARNTVYAAVGTQTLPEGFIVAFRPGATGGGDGGGGGGGGGGAPAQPGSLVVAGPQATSYGFGATAMPKGGALNLLNLDSAGHDVVARDKGADGKPLFRSEIGQLGAPTPVVGADKLAGGRSYGFFCSIHPSMGGTLQVGP